ncbi:hypothetical protein M426DRAFT_16734 [Hypoxylon sp. CI-4A]|nr:hypothetical protein M426DRAFT_16734 [Hypoxylon sp. CI-4A]
MLASSLILGALPLTWSLSAKALHEGNDYECTTKYQRKSWNDLTANERLDYVNADLCLMSTPAKSGIDGAKSRWDELQYVHIVQVDYVHFVGAFLPFHRYFIKVHETLLRNECNYTGPLPYWDEPADIGKIKDSALFDVDTGFGGNGTGVGGCIADGPFANTTLRFKEDLSLSNYCIARSLNDRSLTGASSEYVDACLAADNFTAVWSCLEGRPHGAGHGGVSGTMINLYLSPGDPIFYLHHGYLDKLWWNWQSLNLTTRLTEVGGNNTASFPGFGPGGPGSPGFPPGGNPIGGGNSSFPIPPSLNFSNPFPFPNSNKTVNKAFTDYFNDGGNITTLNHTLWSANILENVTIADVMDPRGGFVCAEYP